MVTLKSIGHLEVKSAARGTVQAVFATLGRRDLDGDVTLPGAFEDGASVRISAFGHASWGGAPPVGKGTIRTVGKEAILDGQFFMDTQQGRDHFTVVKELEELQEWSYGFDVVTSSFGEHEGQRVRFLKRLKVHEVSPVMLGAAGPGMTRTLVAKSRSRAAADELPAAEREFLQKLQLRLIAERHLQRQADMEFRAKLDAEVDRAIRAFGYAYSEDLDWAPWARTRSAAQAAVKRYARELGLIAPPSIRWFSEETDGEDVFHRSLVPVQGLTYPKLRPREIWLHSGLSPADAWVIAGHEVAHLAGRDETAAMAFEEHCRTDLGDLA